MTVRVVLGAQQIEFARHVARNWRRAAIVHGRQHTNKLVTDEALAAGINLLGARCEAAAWKYLKPITWNYWADDSVDGLADLSHWIDIKGVDRGDRDFRPTLIVPPKNHGRMPPRRWAYLLVDATHHPAYDLIGWQWGYLFLDDAHWDRTLPRPAWRARRPYRDPVDLRRLVRNAALHRDTETG